MTPLLEHSFNLIFFFSDFWIHWTTFWGYFGPVLFSLTIFYLCFPEKFEKIITHVYWVLGKVSRKLEKRAVSREVRYIVRSKFVENFEVEEIPELVIEWGDEEKVLLDVKRGRLVIVLRPGRDRYENLGRALVASIPELLAPEMRAVFSEEIIACLSTHVARNIASDHPSAVSAINDVIRARIEENPRFKELSSMLVEIDDRSLLSRILIPELVHIAKIRYPHRDPSIDKEVEELIHMLYKLARGEEIGGMPVVYGKYIRVGFLLVAKPEKIEKFFEPHLKFVQNMLKRYEEMDSIYVLAAGKNVDAGRVCTMMVQDMLIAAGKQVVEKTYVYEGRYKDIPKIKLYVGKLSLK